ncbi:ALP1-like protein [Tanacetum coccineum]
MSSDLFFDTSSDDEDEVNSELVMFTEACQAAYEASKPKVHRTLVQRDRYGAHDRLVMAYFSEHPQYEEATFRERFRMSRRLFTKIVQECTSAIRQLAYGCVPDSLDEYLQKGATTARKCLENFCKVIMNLYGEEFLRKPTYTDIEKLYVYHNEKHGFPRMLGSIDCTDCSWANCPAAFKAQFSKGDHGPYPFILLEAIASQDLWIWHAFFGVSGMNNDVNILRQSPLFNDLKSGRAPDVPFVHEAARKDVERAFGVLNQKWKIIKYPARGLTRSRLSDIMYTCIILHNMIIHDNGNAISPEFFSKEQHRDDDPVRTHQESMQVTQEIIDRTAHLRLAECKVSASNLRCIQVKDIIKEVEDYLKTYSSAGMDISWNPTLRVRKWVESLTFKRPPQVSTPSSCPTRHMTGFTTQHKGGNFISVIVPTGSVVTTGSVIVPAGSVIVPTGSVVTTGSVIVPAGSVIVPAGSVIVPTGSVVTTGSVIVPAGSVIVPAGSVIVPAGSVITSAEFLY